MQINRFATAGLYWLPFSYHLPRLCCASRCRLPHTVDATYLTIQPRREVPTCLIMLRGGAVDRAVSVSGGRSALWPTHAAALLWLLAEPRAVAVLLSFSYIPWRRRVFFLDWHDLWRSRVNDCQAASQCARRKQWPDDYELFFFSLAAGTVINYSRVAVISVATGALGQMEVAAFHPPRTWSQKAQISLKYNGKRKRANGGALLEIGSLSRGHRVNFLPFWLLNNEPNSFSAKAPPRWSGWGADDASHTRWSAMEGDNVLHVPRTFGVSTLQPPYAAYTLYFSRRRQRRATSSTRHCLC